MEGFTVSTSCTPTTWGGAATSPTAATRWTRIRGGWASGKKLVLHSLEQAKALGFRIMQFNAVVKTNLGALHLYERLGFQPLGTIPGGFRMDDKYEDIVPMFRVL